MMLLVGLGNPGQKYLKNRHNIGFAVIEKIASYYKFSEFQKKFQGKISKGSIEGEKVIALKPETFMNESGLAVKETGSFFKIKPQNIIVFHDDIDLELFKIKIKCGGGHAGHNGIKSIDQFVGKEYWRIRLGIGRPEEREQVNKHVLSNFKDFEEKKYKEIFKSIATEIPQLVHGNHSTFIEKISNSISSIDLAPKKNNHGI